MKPDLAEQKNHCDYSRDLQGFGLGHLGCKMRRDSDIEHQMNVSMVGALKGSGWNLADLQCIHFF